MDKKTVKRNHRKFMEKIQSFAKRSKNIEIVFSRSIFEICAMQINVKHFLRTPVAHEMINFIKTVCQYEEDHWYRNFDWANEGDVECGYEISVNLNY